MLYLNDGEIAFDGPDGMHANRICEDLIRRGEIQPLIVVAIANGPGSQRYIDYSPWPAPYYQPNGGGDFYLQAIRDTLKLEIDRRYRTLRDPSNTAIAGFSLGGLISVYAGYAYDSTFGKVAGFSPSYGWSNFHSYVQNRGRPRLLLRFYQDTGYPDDTWIYAMERIALDQGFRPGVDFMSVVAPGGQHSADAVEHRLPTMLKFLFPP